MFRVTQFLHELERPTEVRPRRNLPGPVVIWNLIRRCNLSCQHCYTNSTDREFSGELSTSEVFAVMDDLRAFGVPVLILSGGEPLLRPDLFDIARRSKALGFYTGLSSNGTRITEENIDRIAEVGFDYVGVSLDGTGGVHDRFRGKQGAFEAAMRGIRLCKERGIKVGLRFTLTQDNFESLKDVVALLGEHDLDKFYLSHLNYSGRGNTNRRGDAHFELTRRAMDFLFDEAWKNVKAGGTREFVTGNNDADGAYLLKWVQERFPEKAAHIRAKLEQWGGNATGVNISNIDNLGNVHPDSFWWDHTLGNVRERPFSAIWSDLSSPLLAGLRASPRKIGGRCGRCAHFSLCGGNTRVRAYQTSGDFWAEDPGCYLTDEEISDRPPSPTVIDALQAVGTGKKGSTDCSPGLAEGLARELCAGQVAATSKAAFFAALYLKTAAETERVLVDLLPRGAFDDPAALTDALAPEAPAEVRRTCARLLGQELLTQEQAHALGRFLFDARPGDSARALIASVLRMRHSEAPEYAGLLAAMHETVEPAFRGETPAGAPVAQLAEPFDGMDRSWALTPLLAASLVTRGYRAITMTGRCAGPKFGLTSEALATELRQPRLGALSDLARPQGPLGWIARQADLSRAVDRWIELRREIVKRPFLATLEKYLAPWRRDLFIGSAFHHGFGEKMIETAELAGFRSAIVTFKGVEGSLGLSLARTSVLVAARRCADDRFEERIFELKPADLGFEPTPDEKSTPGVEENCRLIRRFHETGGSGNPYFDARARYSVAAYARALDWIESGRI